MSKILVTGGAGYVGCQVVSDMIKRYPDVKPVVLDNLSAGKIESLKTIIEQFPEKINVIPWENADIRDYDKIERVFEKIKPEAVVHLAAIVDAANADRPGKDEECRKINYSASVELAKIAKKNKTKIFINQSSLSIYQRDDNIKEEGRKNPLGIYGLTKLMAEERIAKLNNSDFKVCSLRPAPIVGYNPGFKYQTIINLCCVRAVYDIPVTIFETALNNPKSYLDVKDNSSAIFFAMENIGRLHGESYNVASFNAPLREVILLIEGYLGKKMRYNLIKEKTINPHVYTINCDKIRNLGFVPKGNLKENIKTTLEALIKNKK